MSTGVEGAKDHIRGVRRTYPDLPEAGDDALQLRARTLVPFEVRGDTVRYDQLAWMLQLRCRAGACLITRSEVVEQALIESIPMSPVPDDPPV